MKPRSFVMLTAALFLLSEAALAQPPGWDGGNQDRGGRGRREGRGGGGPMGPMDQQGADRRMQGIEFMLRSMDTNGDGMISPDELQGRRKQMFERMAQNAGLDPTKPIKVDTIKEAWMKSMQQPGGPWGGGNGPVPPGGNPASGSKPAVPGFGPPSGASTTVSGFGPPPAAASGSSAPSTSGGSSSAATSTSGSTETASSPPSAELNERYRKYAESLLRQYDKNKSGVLERDEWMQMRENLRDADRNKDGIITVEELTAKLAEYTQKRGDSGRSSSDQGSSSSTSNTSDSSGRKSYRFLLPQERLPKGLPDWFTSKDKNQDGQVSMAEYASVWSKNMAEEFAKYDTNNDGVITPAELLKGPKKESR